MDFMILNKWFQENHMTINTEKCHSVVIESKVPLHKIMLHGNDSTSFYEEKLLGFLLDIKVNLSPHKFSLQKTAQKINVVTRLKKVLYLR